MAIILNDNLKINAGKPIDSKYLNASNLPYVDVVAVKAALPQAVRHLGLTVNVANVDYWWHLGTGDGDLIVKNSGSAAGTSITGATNGLSVVDKNVVLGGTLTGDTTIIGRANFHLQQFNSFNVGIYDGFGEAPRFDFDINGFTYYSQLEGAGIIYGGDYEANFIDRSLVTKQYVTGLTSQLRPIASDNQIIFNNNDVISGSTNLQYIHGINALQVGQCSEACGCNSVAMAGGYTETGATYSVAMAKGTAEGKNSVAMALGNTCGLNSVGMTCGSLACGSSSVAMAGGYSYGAASVAMAKGVTCGQRSVAMAGGYSCGIQSVAMANGQARGNCSVAMTGGQARGCFSVAMASGTTFSNYSLVLGSGNTLGGDNTNSVLLGGHNITVPPDLYPNTVIVSDLAIWNTPSGTGNMLAWDSATKRVCLSSGGTTPIASDTQIIFKSGTTLVGNVNLVYCHGINALQVGEYSIASGQNSVAMANGQACGESSVAMAGGYNCGLSSVAMANGIASGNYSVAMANGSADGQSSVAMAGGIARGNCSVAMAYGTTFSNYSLVHGQSNILNSGNTNSVLLGGENIEVPADLYPNTVIVSDLAIWNTPSAGATTDEVLVWNTTDKKVKVVSGSSGDKNNIYSKTTISVSTQLDTGSTYVILVNHTIPITITLPAIPLDGQAFKIKDVSTGGALINNITIARNGNSIDRGANNATINTDSGALELVFDATLGSWFTLAFVN